MQYFSLFFRAVTVTKFGKRFLKINIVYIIFKLELGGVYVNQM